MNMNAKVDSERAQSPQQLTGFAIRAGGQQNSPAISRELAAHFSLEITPQKAKI